MGDSKGSFFRGGDYVRKLKKYKPTKFMAEDSHYDKAEADFAVSFIENLCHTMVMVSESLLVSLTRPRVANPSEHLLQHLSPMIFLTLSTS